MEKINKFILKAREENRKNHPDRPDNYFNASSAGSCMRRTYYSKRIEKPIPIKTLLIFKLGEIIHEFFQEAIPGENEMAIKIVDTNRGIEVSGRIDKVTEEGEIQEFKTTSNLKFSKDKPDSNHVKQINLYVGYLKKPFGRLVYIDKRTMETAEHIIKFDEKLFDETLEEFSKIHKCLQKGKLPSKTKDANQNRYPCSYCLYKEECWENK